MQQQFRVDLPGRIPEEPRVRSQEIWTSLPAHLTDTFPSCASTSPAGVHIMWLISHAKHCVSAHYHQLWQKSVPGGSERAWRVHLQVEVVTYWPWTALLNTKYSPSLQGNTCIEPSDLLETANTLRGQALCVYFLKKMERKSGENRYEKLSIFLLHYPKLFCFRNIKIFP